MDGLRVTVDLPDLREVRRAVKLAGRVRVFPTFQAHATGAAIPYDVDLDARFEDGRFRVKQLVAHQRPKGDGVSNEGLRLIPVAKILQAAVEEIVIEGDWGPNVVDWGPMVLPERLPEGPGEDQLELVAALYRLAYVCSVPPTQYVARRLKLPQSTAARWVSRARKAGHLGPAVGTRAGEGEKQ